MNVYDNWQNRWISVRASEIPWTYTFAEKPTNYRMEARLWLNLFRRVKHRIIWFKKKIPVDEKRPKCQKLQSLFVRYLLMFWMFSRILPFLRFNVMQGMQAMHVMDVM